MNFLLIPSLKFAHTWRSNRQNKK